MNLLWTLLGVSDKNSEHVQAPRKSFRVFSQMAGLRWAGPQSQKDQAWLLHCCAGTHQQGVMCRGRVSLCKIL